MAIWFMRDSDIAYDMLKKMIVTLELRPGQALIINEIMEQLGLGRTPIREALNRLAWENFVKIVPKQCMLVNEMSLHDLESIYRMRLALSPLESELAIMNRTEEDLKQLWLDIEVLGRETDQRKRVLMDRAFHRTISSMSKDSFLENDMNKYLDLSTRLLFLNQEHLKAMDDKLTQDHIEIYKCLKERDKEALINVQKRHIINFKSKFISSFK